MRKNILQSELKDKIVSIYNHAKLFKLSQTELCNKLQIEIYYPLNELYSNGRRKFPNSLYYFALGVSYVMGDRILNEYTEFCYIYQGELYSTHRESSHNTTKMLDNLSVLNECESHFYWKNSDKIYF